VSEHEDRNEPWYDDLADDDGYPRFRLRRLIVRTVALVLIVGMLLVFPLGYLLDAELRNQHLEAAGALIEVVVLVVIIAAMRSRRRL
jgi:hypothetical protein